jgi:hypothetical protein
MNRRELLQRAGALTTVVGLAGCVGTASRSNPPNGETTTDDLETTTMDEFGDDFAGVKSDRDDPFAELSVGSRDGVAFPDTNRPHVVQVWNAAEESRDLLVRVSRGATDLLDRTVEFDADAYLTITLNEPADYRVAVGVAGEVPTTFGVGRGLFDCNASTTDAGVAPDGTVATITESTTMACHGPHVGETAFDVGQGKCGTENSASVAFEGEQVRVDGTVRTPTPQSGLSLADVSYDERAGTLAVRVRESGGDTPEPGVECVGTVPYEAIVGFEYDLPDEVAVVHESMDQTKEVTRTAR